MVDGWYNKLTDKIDPNLNMQVMLDKVHVVFGGKCRTYILQCYRVINMKYGQTIYNLRKDRGLSQERVAEELQVTRQSISLWETDQASPSIDNLLLLSKLFNVSIDDILNNNVGVTDSNFRKVQVIYTEDMKTLLITKGYLQIILLLIYPVIYLLTFSIVDIINYFSNNINYNYSIVLRIGLSILIVTSLIFGVVLTYSKFRKTLSEKREFTYLFGKDKLIVTINGKNRLETEIIEYEDIKKVLEARNYVLLVSANTIYYLPKTDEYSNLFNLLKERQIKISNYTSKLSRITISKLLCMIMPLLSVVSTMVIAGLVTESSDLLLWILMALIPVVTIVHGKYSMRIIRKMYSIPSIIIGNLCLLMDLIGFIVIF